MGNIVQYACKDDIQQLEKLWIECFPEDADGFAYRFLNNYRAVDDKQCCVVLSEDGQLESALYWLPCRWQYNGENAQAENAQVIYVYAMATSAQYRKRGNLMRMLSFVHQHALNNGISAIILNALDTSRGVVERFGMKPLISWSEEHCKGRGKSGNDVELTSTATSFVPSYDDFQRMRMKLLANKPSAIYWEGNELDFIYKELCLDGSLHGFAIGGEQYYAILKEIIDAEGSYTLVEECNCKEILLDTICGNICFLGSGKGRYAAHIMLLDERISEAEAAQAYTALLMK